MATLKTVSGSTLVSKAPAPDLGNALIEAFGTPKSRAADKEAKAKAKAQKARDAQKAADIAILTGETPPYVPEEKEESSSVFDSFKDTFSDIFGLEEDELEIKTMPVTPDTPPSKIKTMPVTPDTPPSKIVNVEERQNAKLRLVLGGGKEAVEAFEKIKSDGDERQKTIAQEQLKRATLQSDFILQQGRTKKSIDEAIKLVITDNKMKNLETAELEKILGATYDEQVAFFQYKKGLGNDLETLFAEPPTAQTDIGQLQQDLNNRYITQEQYDKLFTAQMLENEAGGRVKDLAPEILATFPASVRAAANAVYVSSGGGDDGIKAVKNYTDRLQDVSKASNLPETLNIIFPNTSPGDFAALENVVRSAASIDEGIVLATKLRETQLKEEKSAVFADRAIELLQRVINDDELRDVTGSLEGGLIGDVASNVLNIDGGEVNLIQDIAELRDLLTADNLNIMTGVLSETDIKIIANLASGGLNRKRTVEAFTEDATRILNLMKTAQAKRPEQSGSAKLLNALIIEETAVKALISRAQNGEKLNQKEMNKILKADLSQNSTPEEIAFKFFTLKENAKNATQNSNNNSKVFNFDKDGNPI